VNDEVNSLYGGYIERDGMYAITPLKRGPKDFSLRDHT
jgi:hypothetical protein